MGIIIYLQSSAGLTCKKIQNFDATACVKLSQRGLTATNQNYSGGIAEQLRVLVVGPNVSYRKIYTYILLLENTGPFRRRQAAI